MGGGEAVDVVGEGAGGEEVGGDGYAARGAGEDRGEAFACAGDVADLDRAVDAFGEEGGGG
ncbi:hypothetical protein [Kribbella qitaiheensis]|uniref:hypothetical protein n=1 Tax=Kribbella qitaiheensis TaxID=1544730 RepID=UPI001FE864CC|nr:hypothetical protein [Kribbella qitaiheensis]